MSDGHRNKAGVTCVQRQVPNLLIQAFAPIYHIKKLIRDTTRYRSGMLRGSGLLMQYLKCVFAVLGGFSICAAVILFCLGHHHLAWYALLVASTSGFMNNGCLFIIQRYLERGHHIKPTQAQIQKQKQLAAQQEEQIIQATNRVYEIVKQQRIQEHKNGAEILSDVESNDIYKVIALYLSGISQYDSDFNYVATVQYKSRLLARSLKKNLRSHENREKIDDILNAEGGKQLIQDFAKKQHLNLTEDESSRLLRALRFAFAKVSMPGKEALKLVRDTLLKYVLDETTQVIEIQRFTDSLVLKTSLFQALLQMTFFACCFYGFLGELGLVDIHLPIIHMLFACALLLFCLDSLIINPLQVRLIVEQIEKSNTIKSKVNKIIYRALAKSQREQGLTGDQSLQQTIEQMHHQLQEKHVDSDEIQGVIYDESTPDDFNLEVTLRQAKRDIPTGIAV